MSDDNNVFTIDALRARSGESELEYQRRRKLVWMNRAQWTLWLLIASIGLNIYLWMR